VAAADEIFVLDHGRIAERGRHTALAGAGGLYARLAELQRAEEAEITEAAEARP
jgi:ATP-binding cassette subfamily B protein/ATP-binding cassette subfamily C protein/ATP-binding cassette subfamily B multidrug efflux pump